MTKKLCAVTPQPGFAWAVFRFCFCIGARFRGPLKTNNLPVPQGSKSSGRTGSTGWKDKRTICPLRRHPERNHTQALSSSRRASLDGRICGRLSTSVDAKLPASRALVDYRFQWVKDMGMAHRGFPANREIEMVLLALQGFQVLFLWVHDWIPLGRLNDVAAVRGQDTTRRLVTVTLISKCSLDDRTVL